MSRETVWILGSAVLMAGAVLFGSWNWRIYSEADTRLVRAGMVEAGNRSLRATGEQSALQIRRLTESLQSASNRMAEVERMLEAEKRTHDPLRRQIEKLLAEQIVLMDSLKVRAAATNTVAASTVSMP